MSGKVGPQIEEPLGSYLPGGGHQIQMLVSPAERMKYLKVVEIKKLIKGLLIMFFTNESKTSWKINDIEISINMDQIVNVKPYENSGLVAYLAGENPHNPERLVIFSVDGKEIFNIGKPNGYQFIYLSSHPKAEVAVVCGVVDIENSNESWSDFYFGLNQETGKLEKLGVAR